MIQRNILYVTSEAYPLKKTGGLGDVAGSLPRAIKAQHQDIRLLLPAYPQAITRARQLKTLTTLRIGEYLVTLKECTLPGTRVKTWLLDYPPLFERKGNPYHTAEGVPWPDNAERFALFAQVAVELAQNRAGLDWQADIVHCNDWQSGLVPALLSLEKNRPATVFTIHNLAYQGLFPHQTFTELGLPAAFWSYEALEYHGQLSFLKGGLVYADRINTVSPTYAEEIQTAEFGCGLDGLLRYRHHRLSGILNGINVDEWNPGKDPLLVRPYNSKSLDRKTENKRPLQQALGLPSDRQMPMLGIVSRLVQQKGIDLIIDILSQLLKLPLQLVILGSGEKTYENTLKKWVGRYPQQLAMHIGYDEQLAHRIEAGADMFLMPSRFEPCGLNQLYSMRYGTIPIVRRVGGLADTVTNATSATLLSKTANGITFELESGASLLTAIQQGLALYRDKPVWKQLQLTGMRQDFSWQRSAEEYLALYQKAIDDTAQ